MRTGNYLGGLLRIPFVNNYLKSRIKEGGPNEEKRKSGKSNLFGETKDKLGNRKRALLECSESYLLTSQTAVLIAEKIMAGNFIPGFCTQSLAYGPDLILEVPGTVRTLV